MDIQTLQRVLSLLAPQVDEATHTHFTNILRKEYLMDEIDIREQYLAQKVCNAALARQYREELPVLQAKLNVLLTHHH
jgi:hypothetical protein